MNSSQVVVLREKLRRPATTGLARERLERRLADPTPATLDLVVAPAGSGKTTLLARVAEAAPVPVGWFRLTPDDDSEPALAAHIAAALRPLPAPADSICGVLAALEQWAETGAQAWLILDDAHEIAGTPAERALERFVTLRPPALRVIVGSRRTPELNVPRIRVSGSVREISGDDLRFRSWEVEELFASVYREPLRPAAAAALTRRTGGWAAGLQLFHLATAGRDAAQRHHAVSELGSSRLVRAYLTRNVLAELPLERREFLLRTATLGRLSGRLCDALLHTTGSGQVLRELASQQLFTLEDSDGFFRYHEVLRSHLELALTEEYGAAHARSWFARSGAVLEQAGEAGAAARAYAKAEDWNAVSRLVNTLGTTAALDIDPAGDSPVAGPKPPARIRISCLGEFRFDVDGHPADLTQLRPQARMLLRLLAVNPDADVHRERLAEVLWPGVRTAQAGHRLQVAVSSIRRLLDGTGAQLCRNGESYRLQLPPGSAVDVRDFESALALAAAPGTQPAARVAARQRALDIYGGDLLSADGPAEHIAAERERLRAAAAGAAAELAAEYWRGGQREQALHAAQTALRLDEFQDLPWTILANLHEEANDFSAAAMVRRGHARMRAALASPES